MKILFIGDVVGKPGRTALADALPALREKHKPDLVIVNGENSASGFGITEPIVDEFFKLGVGVITSGNHIWDKRDAETFTANYDRLIRPANFSPAAPGHGWVKLDIKGFKTLVANVQGRVTMPPNDCPFRAMERILEENKGVKPIIVDIHAEATSEKEAFARYFDGKISAVIGTHTHVQTADERILPGGTAFITDAGFTGGAGGVIGNEKEAVFERFLIGLPRKLEPEKTEPTVMGVALEISATNGKALAIERVMMKL